jgi:hypothetical protein
MAVQYQNMTKVDAVFHMSLSVVRVLIAILTEYNLRANK